LPEYKHSSSSFGNINFKKTYGGRTEAFASLKYVGDKNNVLPVGFRIEK
jgi:hypothetical protein